MKLLTLASQTEKKVKCCSLKNTQNIYYILKKKKKTKNLLIKLLYLSRAVTFGLSERP